MLLANSQCRPVFDFSYDLLYCMHDFVCMCDGWIGDPFVLEVNCVGESFFLGGFYMTCMRAVMDW